MKRSKKISLGLMAGSALVLTACGEDPVEVAPFKTLEACQKDPAYTDQQCSDAFEAAKRDHQASAPRYTSKSLCEEEFGIGQCAQPSGVGTHSYWSPFFQGYLVSTILSSGHSSIYGRPYYRYRDGGFYTLGGSRLRYGSDGKMSVSKSSMTVKPKAAKVQTRTSVVSRGGFGSRSSSRSSWGG